MARTRSRGPASPPPSPAPRPSKKRSSRSALDPIHESAEDAHGAPEASEDHAKAGQQLTTPRSKKTKCGPATGLTQGIERFKMVSVSKPRAKGPRQPGNAMRQPNFTPDRLPTVEEDVSPHPQTQTSDLAKHDAAEDGDDDTPRSPTRSALKRNAPSRSESPSTQIEVFREAQEAFERSRNQLRILGFAEGDPTAEESIEAIRNVIGKARRDVFHIIPGEIADVNEDGRYVPEMVRLIDRLVRGDLAGSIRQELREEAEREYRAQFTEKLEDFKRSVSKNEADRIHAELQPTITSTRAVIDQQSATIATLRRSLEQSEDQLDAERRRSAELEHESEENRRTTERHQNASRKYEADNKSLETVVNSLEEKIQTLSNDVRDTQAACEDAWRRAAEGEIEKQELQGKNQELLQKCADAAKIAAEMKSILLP